MNKQHTDSAQNYNCKKNYYSLKYSNNTVIYSLILLLLIIALCRMELYSQAYIQTAKIVSPDRAENDEFGVSVSIFEDYALIGSWHQNDTIGDSIIVEDAGAVYCYKKDEANNWVMNQKIVASDPDTNHWFGRSVSIYDTYCVIGSHGNTTDSNGENKLFRSGAAYIFELDNDGNWVEIQKIVSSDRNREEAYGYSVALDEDYLVIGNYKDCQDENGEDSIYFAGSAFIYERDVNNIWDEVQKIVASDRDYLDIFGNEVSISGNYIIVGAVYEDEDINGSNTLQYAGSAYIFERDDFGNWNETQKIVASDRSSNVRFGFSVSVFDEYAIVGANFDHNGLVGMDSLSGAGSAYIFERNNNGIWTEIQKIVASDRSSADNFGSSVSQSSDTAVISAIGEADGNGGGNPAPGSGSAYIFVHENNGNWSEIQKIAATDRDTADYFGFSTSIYGNSIIIGALREDEDSNGQNTIINAGSAYIFGTTSTGIIVSEAIESKIILYPNPAKDEIAISNPQEIKLNEAYIFNMGGTLIKTINLTNMGKEKLIDISDLVGSTFIILIKGDNVRVTKQLIKK